MNPEPPPIAAPHSTAPTPKVVPTASSLAKSGWKLVGVAVALFVVGVVSPHLHRLTVILYAVQMIVIFSGIACFILGGLRLVRALPLFIRSFIK